MAKKMNKWMARSAFLALSVVTVLGASSPSWAGSPDRPYRRHHAKPSQVEMCAPWEDCGGSGFVPQRPRHPAYDPYERDYDDDRDYSDERPYYPYDPYERTITIPAPELPRGTDKIIEGMFELIR